MNKYVIFTDSCCDLTTEMYESLGLRVLQFDVIMEGEKPTPNDRLDIKEVYEKLRAKKAASTSAINMERFYNAFEGAVQEGYDVLYLGFSSGLSATYHASTIAAQELSEKYPHRKIYTVDTLCASMGEGLLVYLAAKLKHSGASMEDVRDYVENNRLNLCHWFTVDDLFFLKRGGRVNAALAVAGTILSIKPVLHVDNNGKLINVSKVRGRKASIDTMFEKMKATLLPNQNDVVFISHGDCIEDAEYLAGRIKNELAISEVGINYIGPVIGSHSGPGTLALFFLGTER